VSLLNLDFMLKIFKLAVPYSSYLSILTFQGETGSFQDFTELLLKTGKKNLLT